MTSEVPQKTTQLTPEEWKQLCILNVTQLHSFIQGIPSHTEGGVAGINDHHLALIEGHLQRGAAFLRAWQKSKTIIPVAEEAAPQETADEAPKRKGGWPKGKKRTARGAQDNEATA